MLVPFDVIFRRVTRPMALVTIVLASAPPVIGQGNTFRVEREAIIEGDFTYVGEAVIARAGNLIVSQPGDRHIAVVKSGTHRPIRVGRPGEGPGEFRNVARVGLTTQGFWAFDAILKRVNLYSNPGTFIKSLSIPAFILEGYRVRSQSMVLPSLLAMIGDDSLLLVATGSASASLGGIGLGEKHFFVGGVGTDGFRRIATLAAATECAFTTANSTVTLPNCAIPRVLTRPDGRGLVFVTTVWNPRASVVVESFDLRGNTLYRRSIPMNPPRVERDIMDSNAVRLKRRFPTATLPSLPAHYPPLTGAIMGSDGVVWLGVRGDSGTTAWVRLNHDGKDGGRIVLPPKTRLVAADGRTLWAESLDDDDIPSLVKFRIQGSSR